VGQFTNEFAAMPSLHVGWALWCGWQLVRHGKHRITQIAGVLYPALMVVIVIATGNHYLLDAAAGVAVVVLAGMAVGGVQRLRPAKVIDLDAHRVVDVTDRSQVPAPRTSATA
jgi:membrane-associated phospholipid phosphatase